MTLHPHEKARVVKKEKLYSKKEFHEVDWRKWRHACRYHRGRRKSFENYKWKTEIRLRFEIKLFLLIFMAWGRTHKKKKESFSVRKKKSLKRWWWRGKKTTGRRKWPRLRPWLLKNKGRKLVCLFSLFQKCLFSRLYLKKFAILFIRKLWTIIYKVNIVNFYHHHHHHRHF